jgi:hypothetical protein
MNPRIFAALAVGLFVACNAQVLPVAENGGGDAGPGQDSGGNNGQDSGSSGGNDGGNGADGNTAKDGGSPQCGDAGGFSCLCGEVVCVDGQWTCTSCGTDGGPGGCSPPCGAGSICVRDQVMGGAVVLPDDAGGCPSGYYSNGSICERDPSFFCAPLPSGCNGTVTCGCAGTLCTTQQTCPYQCRNATSNEVDCECDVP